jgi:hypothetical protein
MIMRRGGNPFLGRDSRCGGDLHNLIGGRENSDVAFFCVMRPLR